MSSKKEEAGLSESDSESMEISATPSFKRNDILVCATHGKVYAIHKRNGSRLWRAEFGATGGVVSVFITDYDRVIAAGNGKTACFNIFTGETLWINKMKGCGLQEVGAISTPSRVLRPGRHLPTDEHEDTREDSLPAYQEEADVNTDRQVIISCTNGKCMGIDAESGDELWLFKCPKGGYKIPTAVLDPATEYHQQPNVYIGCGRMVYCLDPRTGSLKWSTQVSNAKVGYGYMTLTTPWSSRLAAESHTAFSQFPTAQQESVIRNRRNVAIAAGAAGN